MEHRLEVFPRSSIADSPSSPIRMTWSTGRRPQRSPRWTGQGKQISYVLVSDGEAGIESMNTARTGPLRRQEQEASCAVVGVSNISFLGWPDGAIVEGVELHADLAATVREHRPEVVL